MIADAFLALLVALLNGVFATLPAFNAASAATGQLSGDPNSYSGMLGAGSGGMSSLQAAMVIMWQYNLFLPVDHLLAIIGFYVAVQLCVWALDAVRWLIGTIRGSGTGTGAGV